MSICIIKGTEKSGKTLIANALRNNQISNKQGALLIDEDQNGDTDILIEKIIIGEKFDSNRWKELPWKPNSMVILVGEKESMLAEFEEMMPGFAEFFGPVYTVTTDKK